MQIFVVILEFLLQELKKSSLYIKIGLLLLSILESLVLFVLKDETFIVLAQFFSPNELISYFALVVLILPVLSFLFPLLVLSILERTDRLLSAKPQKTPDISKLSANDFDLPNEFTPIKILSATHLSTVLLVTNLQGKKYLLKYLHDGNAAKALELPPETALAQPISYFAHKGKQFELLHYYEGWTLAELIDLNRDKSGVYGELLETWTKQILTQLIPLHSSSPPIVHRDINPTNILVRSDTFEIILLDFSSSIRFSKKNVQIPLGNALYSPSEQLQGKSVPASDLYSLGMTMFAMNRCKHPPSSSARKYGLNQALELMKTSEGTCIKEIFSKCIETDVRNRYRNAQEVLNSFCHPMSHPDYLIGVLKLPDGRAIQMNDLSWNVLQPGQKPKEFYRGYLKRT